jgi:hypothetical protein
MEEGLISRNNIEECMQSKTRTWLGLGIFVAAVFALGVAEEGGASPWIWISGSFIVIGLLAAGIKFEWYKHPEERRPARVRRDTDRRAEEKRSWEKTNELMLAIDKALSLDDDGNAYTIEIEEYERWGESADSHAVNVGGFVSFVVDGNNDTVRAVTEITNPDYTDFDDITLPETTVYDCADLDADTLRKIVEEAYKASVEAEEAMKRDSS